MVSTHHPKKTYRVISVGEDVDLQAAISITCSTSCSAGGFATCTMKERCKQTTDDETGDVVCTGGRCQKSGIGMCTKTCSAIAMEVQ